MKLDHRDPRPIYTQIIDHYRELIAANLLLPGEKLPSVRELAVELAINPNTIQRAYRTLEMEGWIATVPGKGCFACGSPSALEKERDRLLKTFDETASALLALGVTPEDLVQRIRKEEA